MSALSWQAVVAGVGGQGVLFVSRALATALEPKVKGILISEVHGMAQRGGAVVSHLKAGAYSGPLVSPGSAEMVLALDPGEAVRNLSYLAAGGWLVVNAPDLGFLSAKGKKALASFGARAVTVPASELAREAGAAKGANVVLLGAAAAAGALPVDPAEVERAITQGQPEARARANRELLALGAGAAEEA
ncbi:MAG: 2-oxoacid:acceptor oxidoreductase family protein [Desulfarculaceae bacterium]|nr:2-oxoacid:acceptor oxidoreductase family protein [Desulfarculaceae bacterium]MCF8071295.1 2-oxoacid:acceptor oxidoreductase family protein [Desulfarculaceae bacterium]MCF8101620.1 2-oxoacid:acceptor oxidoreductase family protein [Desulfarculaceae bacterium]MCF8117440.1 2-oxoacid:acceptor oxidoreductase family protein [Desulfarculaceae bacterium]